MATLQFTLTSTPLTGSKTYTGSDADISAIIPEMIKRFSPKVGPQLTAAQAFAAWSQWCVNDLKKMVRTSRIAAAQVTANQSVTDIVLT